MGYESGETKVDLQKRFWLRLAVSCLVGLFITGVGFSTVGSAANHIGLKQSMTQRRLSRLDKEVIEYRKRTSALPQSLSQIDPELGDVRDGWRNPFVYSVQGQSHRLVSYGEDGKPGGIGLSCDLSNTNPEPPEARLPFLFLLWHPLSRGIVITAIISGMVTAALTFSTIKPHDFTLGQNSQLASKLCVILVCAAITAFLMASIHIPNGH
jgi:hypothetical protein